MNEKLARESREAVTTPRAVISPATPGRFFRANLLPLLARSNKLFLTYGARTPKPR
jgi:hypothetical protein